MFITKQKWKQWCIYAIAYGTYFRILEYVLVVLDWYRNLYSGSFCFCSNFRINSQIFYLATLACIIIIAKFTEFHKVNHNVHPKKQIVLGFTKVFTFHQGLDVSMQWPIQIAINIYIEMVNYIRGNSCITITFVAWLCCS